MSLGPPRARAAKGRAAKEGQWEGEAFNLEINQPLETMRPLTSLPGVTPSQPGHPREGQSHIWDSYHGPMQRLSPAMERLPHCLPHRTAWSIAPSKDY